MIAINVVIIVKNPTAAVIVLMQIHDSLSTGTNRSEMYAAS